MRKIRQKDRKMKDFHFSNVKKANYLAHFDDQNQNFTVSKTVVSYVHSLIL